MTTETVSKTDGDSFPAFARAILNAATEVEAVEYRIKQEVLTAARAGDTARVAWIVDRWMNLPSMEVLADGP